jgi:hypothetical protein
MIPSELYYTASLLIALIVYVVRVEKCLTSIQKDICYIKKNCPHCKSNPDSTDGDRRSNTNTS